MTAPQNKPAPDADRPKTLSPADAKRLAASAPSLLKVPVQATYPATSERAKHYPEHGSAYCGQASGPLAAGWATTTCQQCLGLRVDARKRLSAQRYQERKRVTKKAATPVATKPLHDPAPVPPSVQDDSRHFRQAASLDEGHVRPSQLVAAIEVMIASAHARRRQDEDAKRPVDRFVWGQLEALRMVRDLVRLAARKERV